MKWNKKHFSFRLTKQTSKKVVNKTFKVFVRYIFTSLFCMSKREDLRNKEKCFYFTSKALFGSWDNQILSFQIFKCHDVIKCLSVKHETCFIKKLVKQTQHGYEIWPVYVTLQDNFFHHKILWEMWPWN